MFKFIKTRNINLIRKVNCMSARFRKSADLQILLQLFSQFVLNMFFWKEHVFDVYADII